MMTPRTMIPHNGVSQHVDENIPGDNEESSGVNIDHYGVSGDFGDLGDEINIEIVKQIEQSKRQRTAMNGTAQAQSSRVVSEFFSAKNASSLESGEKSLFDSGNGSESIQGILKFSFTINTDIKHHF